MPEMLSVTATISMMRLEQVALVTDGRFSGATDGPCVGHVTPEAYEGGPIAILRDGDAITIDIPNRALSVDLSDDLLHVTCAVDGAVVVIDAPWGAEFLQTPAQDELECRQVSLEAEASVKQ